MAEPDAPERIPAAEIFGRDRLPPVHQRASLIGAREGGKRIGRNVQRGLNRRVE
jgi:hypothetical protein